MARKEKTLAELEQDCIDWEKNEAKREVALDVKMKTDGYCWKVVAWIHPSSGGDDYKIRFDFLGTEKPTDTEIVKLLKRRRSDVLDDYQIVSLV